MSSQGENKTKSETKLSPKQKVIAGSKDLDLRTYCPSNHGFVDACKRAYSKHHPLIIRPDDVWIAIMTQFASYMSSHGEEIRETFVSHAGKKELIVYGGGTIITADYEGLSLKMVDQIAANIKDPSIRDWAIPSFSTTKPGDRVVGAMVLMASLKSYFDYKFVLDCGLPKVTLLGTTADWERVLGRAKRLLEFDCKAGLMAKWHSLLEPVLIHFIESSKGRPDLAWWNQVCTQISGGSGPQLFSGWINVFNVFKSNGTWIGNLRPGKPWPVVDDDDYAPGYAEVDVVVDDNGVKYNTTLKAGSMGYVISEDDLSLQPIMSWTLLHKDKSSTTSLNVGRYY